MSSDLVQSWIISSCQSVRRKGGHISCGSLTQTHSNVSFVQLSPTMFQILLSQLKTLGTEDTVQP